jgi:protoporphyrinogen IX oxidase
MMSGLAGFLGGSYLWIQAAHVIFVIFWMAALFMQPRFYVYHHQTVIGSAEDAQWVERENRLRRIIMTPALIIVWILGLVLAVHLGLFSSGGNGWFHTKLLLVVLLSAYHGWLVAYGKKLARGERLLSEKSLRLLNEVPGIAIVLIVVLVIVRPF